MSVIINGMDMPKNCASCDLSYYYDGYNGGYGYNSSGNYCRRLKRLVNDQNMRDSACPLRDYPAPQKPKKEKDKYKCPACGKLVGEELTRRWYVQRFCSDCGQRIDWGDGFHDRPQSASRSDK